MRQEILLNRQKILKNKLGLRLSRAGLLSKLFANQYFAKSGHIIRPEQFTVLATLNENDGMYLRQLGAITCKDRPNMTRIVSILEEKGYVTSVLDSEGRQVKKLYITEKGKQICEEALPTIVQIWSELAEGIPDDEIEKFLETLTKIEENIRKRTIIKA